MSSRRLNKNSFCNLDFTVEKDGSVKINYQWSDNDKNTADIIGLFLSELHHGDYIPILYDILTRTKDGNNNEYDIETRNFLKRIIEAWAETDKLRKELSGKKNVLVSPLKTFGASRFLG